MKKATRTVVEAEVPATFGQLRQLVDLFGDQKPTKKQLESIIAQGWVIADLLNMDPPQLNRADFCLATGTSLFTDFCVCRLAFDRQKPVQQLPPRGWTLQGELPKKDEVLETSGRNERGSYHLITPSHPVKGSDLFDYARKVGYQSVDIVGLVAFAAYVVRDRLFSSPGQITIWAPGLVLTDSEEGNSQEDQLVNLVIDFKSRVFKIGNFLALSNVTFSKEYFSLLFLPRRGDSSLDLLVHYLGRQQSNEVHRLWHQGKISNNDVELILSKVLNSPERRRDITEGIL